jgi:hypothetical membrane protein
MKEKKLLSLGIISPILFWTTTFVSGLMIENYNHLSNLVSELGARNSKPQYLFSTGLVVSSILNIFFVLGLYKVSRLKKITSIPIIPLLFFSFLAGPGIVPMPLKLHGILGIPFPLIMLSPLLALVLWRKFEYELNIRIAAITGLVIMLLGFLIFAPDVLSEYVGLKQRFLYFGWTVWSGFLAFRFLQLSNGPVRMKEN